MTSSRFRKEVAAYKLNRLFEFDNGFPVTAPHDGVMINGVRVSGWVQESLGTDLESGLRDLARRRFGQADDSAVSRLVQQDAALKLQIEQAFVERLIYGDPEDSAQNFSLLSADGSNKVRNRCLEYAFPSGRHEPAWMSASRQGINMKLHADFSEQPLTAHTRSRIARFVQRYDNVEGRAELAKLELRNEEIEGLISRAKWFARWGKFPRAFTARELLETATSDT